jgi:putative ABC transport system permease protein
MPRLLRVLRDRWRALLGRERVTGDIHDELAHHEALLAAELESRGMSPDEARRAARRRFGNRASLQDRGYEVRGGGRAEAVLQDLRYGARVLRANPGFSMVAILTLALGIGANTAIFSVAQGVLLRPLPYPDGDALAMVWMDNARIDLREDWHSYPNYEDYRDTSTTFAAMAVFNRGAWTLTGDGDPERLTGAHSTAELVDVLRIPPALGRWFTTEESDDGANVIVLSHRLWQRRFGGRDDVVGRVIQLSARPVEIIGVMPEGFAFPAPDAEFWVPTTALPGARDGRNSLWLQVVGRLKPGVALGQAQADLERVNAGIVERFPGQRGYGVYVVGLHEQTVGRVRPAILVLLGAVGFVLLIACTNVANLLLARASSRERELALRTAIGAGRGRLVRQLLTESLLLAGLGGAAGLALGWAGLRALVRLAPADLPRLQAIAVDGSVLAFTAGVAILTGVLFGLVPAIHTARTDPGRTLKDGGRGSTGPGGLLRRALVVVEVALAVVLLVGAGLMLRSFARIQEVDLGLQTDGVLTARVALLGEAYRDGAARAEFFRQFVERAEALPEVEGAAAVGTIFLSATPNSTNFSIEGRPPFAVDEQLEVPVDSVTPNYFDVMRVPLVRGRPFDARDTAASIPVVIINDTMARRFWPDEDPVGRRMKYGDSDSQAPWMTIVGVVADTRRTGYESAVRPETYLPQSQGTAFSMALVLRTHGDPAVLVPGLRTVLRGLDPTVALQAPRPLGDVVGEMTAQRRLNTLLLAGFAAVAVLLSGVGIYGVIAHGVARRRRELGVRMALGAPRAGILALVLREGMVLAAAGLVAGLLAAVGLGRLLVSLLYQVSATDPATFAAIAVVAILVAAAASLVPAFRATRVDPVTALRAD